VVLVSIDTLRADHVGCYGAAHARTPTLDALAAAGTRFETAVAPTPLTLPSHSSLLTGLTPAHHGVHHNGIFSLPGDVPTLAERFRDAGYATAAFVGAVVLDSRFGLDRGFEVYDDQMGFRRTTGGAGGHGERRADQVIDAALAWLDGAPPRFFLWVHLYDPHANYDPPPAYRPRNVRGIPEPGAGDFLGSVAASAPPLYAGEIAFADAQLDRLLRAVRERFGSADTLVVATSDHGESLGAHDELTHTLGVYAVTQRVPLLMAGAGVPRGRVVTAPVRLVDVAPTLAAMAGLEPLPGPTGVDLGPWLREERSDALPAYLETLATHLDFGWSPVLGVRTDRYKYLRTTRPELYDLSEDPDETRDLAGERPEQVAELEALLSAGLDGARPLEPTLAVPADERAQLEALGYLVASPSRELPELGWVGGPDPKDRRRAIVALMEARSRLAAGRPDQALAALESAPAAGGWIAEARADAALASGDAAAAERHAREAVDAQPDRAAAQLVLARALEALGRPDEAARAYERAASLDPEGSDALLALGRLARQRGDIEAARSYFERASRAPTPSAEAALRLAALHFEAGQPSRARAYLREAWDAPQVPAEARIRAARAEARAGYPSRALARLDRAIARNPGDAALADARDRIREEHGSIHFPDQGTDPRAPGLRSR
jgi:arylsulfatase A-like enzyme/predicted negative regulator of RcsB-dependent stress response